MAKIAKPVLEMRPLLYCRYVDDCFIVCSTQSEMDKYFQILNEQSEFIRLTREVPKEDWLPFLNVQVHLTRGVQSTKWYRKPSSMNILVHQSSAHPARVKRSIIRNMFQTATEVCSGIEEREESIELARRIARSNGYLTTEARDRRERRRRSGQLSETSRNSERIPFSIPYVSDELSAIVRKCLRKASLEDSVALVEVPPNNLKRMLIRNRIYDRLCTTTDCKICPNGREGDCMISGVVYLIKCSECGDEYIGETIRPLCVRIKEHLDGKSKQRRSSVLGSHRVTKHDGSDFDITVSILAQESNITARKTLEAFWINKKSPGMNRKEECLSITRELTSYLSLIF